jgi:hypothetical protein
MVQAPLELHALGHLLAEEAVDKMVEEVPVAMEQAAVAPQEHVEP